MAKATSKTKVTKNKKTAPEDNIRRLYKSQYDRMIGGVAGGIAEYLRVDPTIVRIVIVLMSLFGGTGVIIYIAGLLIMPESEKKIKSEKSIKTKRSNTGFWGILLIIVGLLIIIPDIGFLRMHTMGMGYRFWEVIVPIMVIAIGAWLLLRPSNSQSVSLSDAKESDSSSGEKNGNIRRELTRSIVDRKISGVCGGIGKYFNIDSTIVRILWVLATLASAGFGILAYIIFIITLSESDNSVKAG